jgi:hypothetical protein
MSHLKHKWAKDAAKILVGKKVVNVRYLTDEERSDMDWSNSSLVIFFDDGSYVFPSADDEGNDAGALFTCTESLPIIPVIRK